MSIKVTSYVWEHSTQKGAGLLLLLAVADAANEDGEAYPKLGTLAVKARMSLSNARLVVNDLEVAGELVVQERPGTSNIYIVPVPWRTKEAVSVRAVPPAPRKKRALPRQPVEGVGHQPVNDPQDSDPINPLVAYPINPLMGGHQPVSGGAINRLDPNRILPVTDPSKETQKIVPDGTDDSDAQDPEPPTPVLKADRDLLLEAVKDALGLGDANYALVARYAQFLTGRVPERDSKRRANGDWHTFQPEPGMDPLEIRAFGLWLDDTYDGAALRKPTSLVDYIGQFRADDTHALYLRRADLTAHSPPSAPEPEDDDEAHDYSAEMTAIFAGLGASKRT